MENGSLYLRKNIGPTDRVVRVVLGVVLILAPIYFHWSLGITAVLAAIGGAQILEGLISY